MENIFRKSKKGRGRNPKYNPKFYVDLQGVNAQTKRGKQNIINAAYAKEELEKLEKKGLNFDWLLRPRFRATILAELGRGFEKAETQIKMVSAAVYICNNKLKCARATELIRLNRVGKRNAKRDLETRLRVAILNHSFSNPDVTKDKIIDSLNNVLNEYTRIFKPPSAK